MLHFQLHPLALSLRASTHSATLIRRYLGLEDGGKEGKDGEGSQEGRKGNASAARTREPRSLAGITICGGRNLAFPVAEIKGGALMSEKERGREEGRKEPR